MTLRNESDPKAHAQYMTLLQAVVENDDAPKLLRMLGDDLDEAERLMKLSPTKLGAELVKMTNKTVEPVSSAPKPIRPVGTGGSKTNAEIDPRDASRADKLSTREWMARRQAQADEAYARSRGRA